MKIAPAGREETLVSRDASITVNLRLRMTAVKGFEAEESPLFQPRAYLFEWLLAARDVYRMGQDGDAVNRLFLAMAHGKLGNSDEARKAYDQAVLWLDKNVETLKKDNLLEEELRRFRSEAAGVLKLKK